MDKFKNLNLCESLKAIMETNTIFHKTDMDIDIDFLREMAKSPRVVDKTLLWLSRPYGTFCDEERQVLQKDTRGYNSWQFYAENYAEKLEVRFLAYAIEVTGIDLKSGDVFGNLYELNFGEHAKDVKNHAEPSNLVNIIFQNGSEKLMQKSEYDKTSYSDFYDTPIHTVRNEPINENALNDALQYFKSKRENECTFANFSRHVTLSDSGRYYFEADRIMREINKLKTPNNYAKDGFMVKVSEIFDFTPLSDLQGIRKALPYEKVKLCTVEDKSGLFVVINAKEIIKARCQLKPSILEQLKANQLLIEDRKVAPKKSKGLEV